MCSSESLRRFLQICQYAGDEEELEGRCRSWPAEDCPDSKVGIGGSLPLPCSDDAAADLFCSQAALARQLPHALVVSYRQRSDRTVCS